MENSGRIPLFTGGKITPLVVRFPQVIVAILSLAAVYFLMKEIVDKSAVENGRKYSVDSTSSGRKFAV